MAYFYFKMALTKTKKVEVLKKVEDILKASTSVVFVHFKGLKVKDTTALRKNLREQGVGLTVAKKTLMNRAFTNHNVEGTAPVLDGEIAIAYGNDAVAPAREVANFAKKFKDNLSIVGGIFEGKFAAGEFMREVAAIPPTQTLRGMFVNVINSPIQGMVIALNEYAKKKA